MNPLVEQCLTPKADANTTIVYAVECVLAGVSVVEFRLAEVDPDQMVTWVDEEPYELCATDTLTLNARVAACQSALQRGVLPLESLEVGRPAPLSTHAQKAA